MGDGNYWSTLATAPTSASAGAKKAFNFTEFFVVVFVVISPTIELQLPSNLVS